MFPHVIKKWYSHTFPFLCVPPPHLFFPFFTFSIYALGSTSLLFCSTRSSNKSNLLGNSGHICLVSAVSGSSLKPGLMERILARIQKTQRLSSILAPSFLSIKLGEKKRADWIPYSSKILWSASLLRCVVPWRLQVLPFRERVVLLRGHIMCQHPAQHLLQPHVREQSKHQLIGTQHLASVFPGSQMGTW